MARQLHQTGQSRLRGIQDARDQDVPAEDTHAPASSRARPSGYGDGLLWAMAEEFERQAYDNRVSLRGRGVPYIYKALAQSVDRSGIRTAESEYDPAGVKRPVRGTELGECLVRFFWDKAPWDPDGDVLAEFTDPMMFEDCLKTMQSRWLDKWVHREFLAAKKIRDAARARERGELVD